MIYSVGAKHSWKWPFYSSLVSFSNGKTWDRDLVRYLIHTGMKASRLCQHAAVHLIHAMILAADHTTNHWERWLITGRLIHMVYFLFSWVKKQLHIFNWAKRDYPLRIWISCCAQFKVIYFWSIYWLREALKKVGATSSFLLFFNPLLKEEWRGVKTNWECNGYNLICFFLCQ